MWASTDQCRRHARGFQVLSLGYQVVVSAASSIKGESWTRSASDLLKGPLKPLSSALTATAASWAPALIPLLVPFAAFPATRLARWAWPTRTLRYRGEATAPPLACYPMWQLVPQSATN